VDRTPHPTAGDWHETALAALRQERDAHRAWLAAQPEAPHGEPMDPAVLRRKRAWCRVQRWRAWQQRRTREESA
jgi:hypothetical protein